MSTGAYVLVKFDSRDKLLPAVQTLDGLTDVGKWNAVDGHHNLVIRLNKSDSSLLEQIQKLDGCTEMTSCDLESDSDNNITLSEDFAYSYLFIETERYKQKAVQSALEKDEAVAFCAPASGGCDLVALVQGENFNQIDRVVNNRFRPLDGVLRLRQDRIILLDRM